MWTLSVILILLYAFFLIAILIGFDRIITFDDLDKESRIKFSVIIPFRNESVHLPKLLDSIKGLDYPEDRFQIIMIDDHSEDDSADIIESFKRSHPELAISLLRSPLKESSGKKAALKSGIKKAENSWIVTTDADCELPSTWLRSLSAFISEKNCSMIIAPVSYQPKNNLLSQFQFLDFLALQGLTVGAFGLDHPILCNGANFAYTRKLFKSLEGFDGNTDYAGGDDLFLLNKAIHSNLSGIGLILSTNAMVTTAEQPAWPAFINQRKRWAAKTRAIGNGFSILASISGICGNLALLISLFLLLIDRIEILVFLSLFLLKFVLDFLCINRASKSLGLTISIPWFLMSSIIYPVYVLSVTISTLFPRFVWKGREHMR